MQPYYPVLESAEASSSAYVQPHTSSFYNRSVTNLIDLSEGDKSTHSGDLLYKAVLEKDSTQINILISDGKIGVDTRDSFGSTALITAAKNGFTDVLQKLIVLHNADINCVDSHGYSALMYALKITDMKIWPYIVQFLLNQNRICINQESYNKGDTALSILEHKGDTALSILEENPAVSDEFLSHIRYQLRLAAERNGDTESAAKINKLEADANTFSHDSYSKLIHACSYGDLNTVLTLIKNPKKILLENKPQPIAALSIVEELIPLYPSNENYLTIKKILIAHLHNINSSETLPQSVIENDVCDNCDIVSFSDDPSIIQAIAKKETDVAITLIKLEVNVNAPNKLGQTALMVAAQRGNAKVLKELIKVEANVNARDIFDRTALMYACASGYLNTVLELLDDPKAKDKNNLLLVDKFNNTAFDIVNNILQRNPQSEDHKIIKDILKTLFPQI